MKSAGPSPRLCAVIVALSVFGGAAVATDLASLSNGDTSHGLKQALDQGINHAVAKLGVKDGFLGNPSVEIPLPPPLAKADKMLRMLGMGKQTDALLVAMNRAAEAVVPAADERRRREEHPDRGR